jgi:hypothetical protein
VSPPFSSSRREDDVATVVRAGATIDVPGPGCLLLSRHHERSPGTAGYAAQGVLGGEDQRYFGLLEHEPQPGRRQIRVQRDVHAAGLEHRQPAHHHFDRPLDADADRGFDTDVPITQPASQLVRPSVQLAAGQRHTAGLHRHRGRERRGTLLEQLVHRLGRHLAHGAVPRRQPRLFRRAGQPSPSVPARRLGGQLAEHPQVVVTQDGDLPGREFPRVVLQLQVHVVAPRSPGERHDQAEVRAVDAAGRIALPADDHLPGRRDLLEVGVDEVGLEQLVTAEIALDGGHRVPAVRQQFTFGLGHGSDQVSPAAVRQ